MFSISESIYPFKYNYALIKPDYLSCLIEIVYNFKSHVVR